MPDVYYSERNLLRAAREGEQITEADVQVLVDRLVRLRRGRDEAERVAMRDWCVRFGVFVGLLDGGVLYAIAGWLPVIAASICALLSGVVGLARFAWNDAKSRTQPSSENAGRP